MQALDEEMDDVKHMNQMMLYSKIVTIRDAQIQEKRYIQQEKEEEERQLDMMMEIERLKALKMYEEREKKRVTDQRRGAQVIIEQIKDRQAQREKEEAEQRRLDAIHAELHEARKQQQAEKERRLAEQAKFERDEFERIIQVQMQQEEAERQRQGEEHGLRLQHASEIRHQIAAREERALQERRDFLEEGNVIRAQIGAERKKLEKIKERKIAQLQKAGVPEKYWSELARKRSRCRRCRMPS